MPGCVTVAEPRYWLTLVSGILECLFFCGVLFGFASLMFVLKEDDYFSQLCVSGINGTIDCTRQDEQFSLVFTIASFLNNFLSMVNGIVFDRFGTTVARLLAIFLYTTGTIFLAISTAELSVMLFPALSCITVGGMLLLLSNMQVGNLFPTHRSTVITLYIGAFDSSAGMFFLFKVMHEQGVSLRTSFIVFSCCSIIHLLRTFLLMPRTHIPHPLPENYTCGLSFGRSNTYRIEKSEKKGTDDATLTVSQDRDKALTAPAEGEKIQASGKGESFWSCCLTWTFQRHLMWMSIIQLRHYLFIGTLDPRLNRLANDDIDLVSDYINAFAITQFCAVLVAPLSGLIMDRHKGKPLAPGETEREADLRSSVLSLIITCLQCLLFSICTTVPFLPLQYVTFILQVFNRSSLYGVNAAFINIAFPACHFGKLFGTSMAVSGVISLLQYACFALINGALEGDPFVVDIVFILLSLLVFIHPIYIFINCRKLARSRNNLHTEVNEMSDG